MSIDVDYEFVHNQVSRINDIISLTDQQFHDVEMICQEIAFNQVVEILLEQRK